MCQVYHLPNRMTYRHNVFAQDGSAIVREIADLVSQRRYGCNSALLPTEQRELLLAYLEELWQELDTLPQGRVS